MLDLAWNAAACLTISESVYEADHAAAHEAGTGFAPHRHVRAENGALALATRHLRQPDTEAPDA